jgi:hypothetical protein
MDKLYGNEVPVTRAINTELVCFGILKKLLKKRKGSILKNTLE